MSLLDIAPSAKTVEINGHQIPVQGISVQSIVQLASRFPDIKNMIAGGEVEFSKIMEMGGEVLGAIIASGCGYLGDAEQEKAAAALPLQAQGDMLVAIMHQTMPRGPEAFLDTMRELGLADLQDQVEDLQSSTHLNGEKPKNAPSNEGDPVTSSTS